MGIADFLRGGAPQETPPVQAVENVPGVEPVAPTPLNPMMRGMLNMLGVTPDQLQSMGPKVVSGVVGAEGRLTAIEERMVVIQDQLDGLQHAIARIADSLTVVVNQQVRNSQTEGV